MAMAVGAHVSPLPMILMAWGLSVVCHMVLIVSALTHPHYSVTCYGKNVTFFGSMSGCKRVLSQPMVHVAHTNPYNI